LLAVSSASSTYVKYASLPPPTRLNIVFDLEMVLKGDPKVLGRANKIYKGPIIRYYLKEV